MDSAVHIAQNFVVARKRILGTRCWVICMHFKLLINSFIYTEYLHVYCAHLRNYPGALNCSVIGLHLLWSLRALETSINTPRVTSGASDCCIDCCDKLS